MSAAAECEIHIPSVDGLEDGKLTVGRTVELTCKTGENISGFNFAQAYLKPADENPYIHKLIAAQSDGEGGFGLKLVFYTAGEHQVQQLLLTDGANEITLNGNVISVASVLPPADPAKPQEPYGPILPMLMAVPVLYYAVFVTVCLLIAGLVWRRLRRVAYYRELKSKVASYESSIPADSQFYKSIRAAEKNSYPMESLEHAFRLYVLRAYKLPMFDLTDAKIQRYFKQTFPAHKEARSMLVRILGEFDEYRRRKTIDANEKADFVKKLYRFVDHYKGITE